MANEKWREMTYINDYEFDPDGKYDDSLYADDWEEIFNELYSRAETTEEYLYNDWIDPQSTRNAYTYRIKKNGHEYIVLKYYDGMYALYEIKPEDEIDENKSVARQVIEKLEKGVSVRQAISEAVQGPQRVIEALSGMDQSTADGLISNLNMWTGGSGKGGWSYSLSGSGAALTVELTANPIEKFDEPVSLDVSNGVLNGELYFKPADEFLAASGPVTFAGLKSILRDLTSQVEMAQQDVAQENVPSSDGDIYGY